MARIIPSGDAFVRKAPRTAIQYAPADTSGSFLSGLERVATSPLTNLAVAGISRIADELDYADREKAENQRRAAVELEMRGLERQKAGMMQAQERGAALGLPPGMTPQQAAAAQEAMVEGGAGAMQARRQAMLEGARLAGLGDQQLEAQRAAIAQQITSAQQQQLADQMGPGRAHFHEREIVEGGGEHLNQLYETGRLSEGDVSRHHDRIRETERRRPYAHVSPIKEAQAGLFAGGEAERLSLEENRLLEEQLRRQEGIKPLAPAALEEQQKAAIIAQNPQAALPSSGELADIQSKLAGTRLKGKSPEELAALVVKVRSMPGVASGGTWKEGRARPGQDGYEELVLVQEAIDALDIDTSIFKGEVLRKGQTAWSGPRTAKALDRLGGYIDKMKAARATAPPERRGAIDAKIAEFQAQIDALRPEMEKRFVPRTLADYKMVVRDTERQMLQAKTPEERARLKKKLDSTIIQARRAVDVQPTSLLEAITGKAGMGAQKKAYDEMTAVEKEFTKQMAEAAKEKRAVRADERAEGAAARAESAEARAQELHPEKLKKAEADARKAQVSAARAARRSLGGKPLTPQGKKAVASASEHVAEMIGGGGQTMVIDGKTYTPESAASAVMAGNLYPELPRTGRKATAAAFADGRKSVGPGMRAEGGRIGALVGQDESEAAAAQRDLDRHSRELWRAEESLLELRKSKIAAHNDSAAVKDIEALIVEQTTIRDGLKILEGFARSRRDTARASAGMRALGGRATMHGYQPVTVTPK